MTLQIDGVLGLLPHRGTMLLVDRVTELVPGEHVVAVKAVTHGERWYRRVADGARRADFGYPHALLLESFNQACAVLVMATWDDGGVDVLDSGVPMLGSYTGITFGPPVLPGDLLEHRVRLTRVQRDAMALEGETLVHGRTVLSATRGLVVRRPAQVLRT